MQAGANEDHMTALGEAFNPVMRVNGGRRSHTTRAAIDPRPSIVSLAGFDPDQLRDAIPEADFVYSQVGSGVLNGEVATLPLESCVLVAGRYSHALTVRGKTGPTGFRVVAV